VIPKEDAQAGCEPPSASERGARASLAPQIVPEPAELEPERGFIRVVARFGLVVAVAACGALVLVQLDSIRSGTSKPATEALVASPSETSHLAASAHAAIASLEPADRIDDPQGSRPNAQSETGLASEPGLAVASAPVGADRPDAALRESWGGKGLVRAEPPTGAEPARSVTAPRSDLRPESPGGSTASSVPNRRALSAEDIEALLKRGQAFISQGDISAARAVLERAADAGDARAALALGATYDPNELKSMGVFGLKPDVARAQAWYAKAVEYGSSEAPRKITLLPKP
jgi:TPR repeat protein